MSVVGINLDRNNLLEALKYTENNVMETANSLKKSEISEKIMQSNIKEGEKNGALVSYKWNMAVEQESEEKYFICNTYQRNSDEDIARVLLENNADEIIQGMVIGANYIGASKSYIYICEDNAQAIKRVQEAISSIKVNINININIDIKLFNRAAMYGDEIASVNILESKLNKKNIAVNYPVSKIFDNRIVTINRPETLIKIYSLFAGDEYEKLASDKLVMLEGVTGKNSIFSISNETSLRDLIYNIARGVDRDKEIKALSVGGNTGVILPGELLDIKINDERIILEDKSAVIKVKLIYEDNCIIDILRNFASTNKVGSCNKCVLCREGSIQIETILTDITEGKAKSEDVELLRKLSKGINVGSGCSFGRNISNTVSSAIEYFNNEFDEHINRKKCSALVCKKYFTYHILGKECKGCEECLEKCPVEAIEGGSNLIHVIDQDECNKCGLCLEVCPHNAIVKAGLIKPKTPPKPVKVGTWKR